MASPLPISARDIHEFRPNADAVKAAQEGLEAAKKAAADAAKAVAAADADADAEALLSADEAATAALKAAEAALLAAEEARGKSDPVFRLRVPSGRIDTLVSCDVQSDPDIPATVDTDRMIRETLDEGEIDGMSLEDRGHLLAALDSFNATGNVPAEMWGRVFPIIRTTGSGRAALASNICAVELIARHRVRHHLVLEGRRGALSDRDLDRDDIKPYLSRIHARITQLSSLTQDDAKN